MLNTSELLTEARELHLNDPNSRAFPDDGGLLRAINSYQRTLYQKARLTAEQVNAQEIGYAYSDLTKVNERLHYFQLPFFLSSVVRVERTDIVEREQILDIRQPAEHTPIRWDADRDNTLTSTDFRYELRGRRFYLHGPVLTNLTFDIIWERQFPDLVVLGTHNSDTVLGSNRVIGFDPTAKVTTGTLWQVDDYYIGAYLQHLKAGDDMHHALGYISDYDGDDTGQAKFTTDFTAALDAAGTYALVPALFPEFHSLLALGGSMRAALGKQNMKLYQTLLHQVQLQEIDFTASIESRQADASRHVHETDGELT